MNDDIISDIVEAARSQPPELQGRWIAEQAIRTQRATDAAISDQDLEAAFDDWFQREWGHLPGEASRSLGRRLGRHLLSGARHAT